MLGYYIFALASLLAGAICLFLARSQAYFGRVEKSYGEAAAQKMTRSLKIWGYFFLVTSGILIIALVFGGGR
jgi:hypothetical protein